MTRRILIPPSRAVGQLFGGIVLTALFYGSKTTEIRRACFGRHFELDYLPLPVIPFWEDLD